MRKSFLTFLCILLCVVDIADRHAVAMAQRQRTGPFAPASATIITTSTEGCPAGYSEAFSGRTLIGTTKAAGNVGTTGGSDSVTPAGTNSAPTFTGSALAGHTHTFTQSSNAATPDLVMEDTTMTGVAASGTTGSTSAGTPAGSVSAPVFTGNALDNRSAFIRVIFCQPS